MTSLRTLLATTIGTLMMSLAIAMGSMWQIEEIWRSLQNGWPYGLPFGNSTWNYWLAHDYWFVAWGASYIMLVVLVIVLLIKLLQATQRLRILEQHA